MSWFVNLIKNEPVLLSTLATAIMGVIVAWHITVSPDQAAAIVTLTTVVGNLFARQATTSILTPDSTPAAAAKIEQAHAALQAAVTPAVPLPAVQQGIPDAVIGGVVEQPPS